MITGHSIATLAKMGHLQKHHVKAAEWLATLPPSDTAWRELEQAWHLVALNQRNGFAPQMRRFMMAPIVSHKTLKLDDNHLGTFREGLNAAYRVMGLTFARAA